MSWEAPLVDLVGLEPTTSSSNQLSYKSKYRPNT